MKPNVLTILFTHNVCWQIKPSRRGGNLLEFYTRIHYENKADVIEYNMKIIELKKHKSKYNLTAKLMYFKLLPCTIAGSTSLCSV